jgi:hypothetical protein
MERTRKEMDSFLSLPSLASLSGSPPSRSPHSSLLASPSSPLASPSSLMHARNQTKPVAQAQKKKRKRKKRKRLLAASPSSALPALPLRDLMTEKQPIARNKADPSPSLSSVCLSTQPTSSAPSPPPPSASASSLESPPLTPGKQLQDVGGEHVDSRGFESDYSDSHCSDYPSQPTKETNSGDLTRKCPICDMVFANFQLQFEHGGVCEGPGESFEDTDCDHDWSGSESESLDLQLKVEAEKSQSAVGVVEC